MYATDTRDSDTLLTTGAGEAADVEQNGSGARRPGALAEEGESSVGVEEAKMTRPKQGLCSLGCQGVTL